MKTRPVGQTDLQISEISFGCAPLGNLYRAYSDTDAQATFTLRNDNAYAVKDVEIGCAFARRDGTHLTSRKRIIPVMVDSKARKRFTRLHVGFVNVHASRINCSVITANRV